MKKIFITLCLTIGLSQLMVAQTKIAVYVSSILSKERNTALADNMVEAFAESDKYIAVNRSHAINELMNEAKIFQESGHIDVTQVVNFTKGFGENQLCAVSVIRIDNTFVFRATIVELATGEILKSTSFKYEYSLSDNNISYNNLYIIANNLIVGLNVLPKRTQLSIKPEKKKHHGHTDLAWGIAGVGYPWSLATSFNFRYGDVVGFGLYADVGMAYTHVNIQSSYVDVLGSHQTDYFWTTVTKFHYAAGAKFYMYKGLNIGVGYGSIHTPKTDIARNVGSLLDKDEEKSIRKQFPENNHGLLIHAGYDFFIPEEEMVAFFLGFNAGISLDLLNGNKVAPYVNLKLGISFMPND